MSKAIHRLASSVIAADRLCNPLHVLRKRIFARHSDFMTIEDKASGVNLQCKVGAYHMFGETWYSRVYDVPGLPIRAGDVVFDLGANQGFFTCFAASKGALVYAFEPVSASYEKLVQNVERNGFKGRVNALQYAVCDRDGTTEMLVSQSKGGGESSINVDFSTRVGVPVAARITVEHRSFAKVLDECEIPSIRLCKIDIEGSELALLSSLAPRHRARIQGFAMEYHPGAYDLRELVTLLLSWGTHQLCLMNERPNVGNIIHLISNQALVSWVESEQEQWSGAATNTRDRFRSAVGQAG